MMTFKNKLILAATAAVTTAVVSGCNSGASATGANHMDASATQIVYADGKRVIDGGATYPVVEGRTSLYVVSDQAAATTVKYGRTPTDNELKAWDTDVTHIKLPPEGHGTVEEGEEIYEAKCVMCHGDFGSGGSGYPSLGGKGKGSDLHKTLKNQRVTADADGPTRLFGSYWPQASTMWWYIHDGMPHPLTKSLSVNETYALTAYMLSINEMVVGDVEVADDDEFELNRDNFAQIVMPNVDGFEPEIRGENGTENVRAYYATAKNFGAQNLNQGAVRCMHDCQEPTVQVVRIAEGGGIKDFLPPMSTVRDLPKEDGAFDPKAAYEANCAMCHSSYLAPGSSEWKGYLAKGMDKVYASAIKGTEGGMPPKGGSSLSDAEFKSVVDYITSGK